MHILRCTHELPIFRHSSHPFAEGFTFRIWFKCVHAIGTHLPSDCKSNISAPLVCASISDYALLSIAGSTSPRSSVIPYSFSLR